MEFESLDLESLSDRQLADGLIAAIKARAEHEKISFARTMMMMLYS